MSNPSSSGSEQNSKTASPDFAGLNREELHSALFAQLVIQQSNMAMMMMGKVPHPDRGEAVRDLETAQLFIDQLEALEIKTRGNLKQHEEALLKQSLMTLRMAFVEAVEVKPPEPALPASTGEAPSPPAESKAAPAETTGAESEAASRKKYSKKFSL